MGFERLWKNAWVSIVVASFVAGCGSGTPSGSLVMADAEFNPASAATAFRPINEANPAVAQTFTVLQDGLLDEFWFVITDGESADDGTVRVTIQPVSVGGVIDADSNHSLIDPIIVNTTSLPAVLVEEFTEFDISSEPGRDVLAGERYAIVVEFVSRATNNDTNAIVRVLGQLPAPGDPFAGGTGATGELDVSFTNNTEDYFFRTFVLTES
jgi:hypothetical protein